MPTCPSFSIRWWSCAASIAATIGVGSLALPAAAPAASAEIVDDERPTLALRALPAVTFSPADVVLAGALTGGPDDYEELCCATVEWDWGDGTRSSTTADCNPYESGKSEIRRRYRVRHLFRRPGRLEITLKLKQDDEVVTYAATTVLIYSGVGRRDDLP